MTHTGPRFPNRQWGLITVVTVLVLALIGAMAFLMARNIDNVSVIKSKDRIISELSQANDDLRDQLISEDLVPVSPPAETITGPQGSSGPKGETGAAGRPPSASEVADAVAGYCGIRGCRGADGATGASGSDGKSGADGSAGAPGADGAQGPAGPPGPPGADGPSGGPGQDGEPPSSWTYMVGLLTYRCDRTDPFDYAAPTYVCNLTG